MNDKMGRQCFAPKKALIGWHVLWRFPKSHLEVWKGLCKVKQFTDSSVGIVYSLRFDTVEIDMWALCHAFSRHQGPFTRPDFKDPILGSENWKQGFTRSAFKV